jgi:hypothetical protein
MPGGDEEGRREGSFNRGVQPRVKGRRAVAGCCPFVGKGTGHCSSLSWKNLLSFVFRVGLLGTKLLSFCLSENVFIWLLWKDFDD